MSLPHRKTAFSVGKSGLFSDGRGNLTVTSASMVPQSGKNPIPGSGVRAGKKEGGSTLVAEKTARGRNQARRTRVRLKDVHRIGGWRKVIDPERGPENKT